MIDSELLKPEAYRFIQSDEHLGLREAIPMEQTMKKVTLMSGV